MRNLLRQQRNIRVRESRNSAGHVRNLAVRSQYATVLGITPSREIVFSRIHPNCVTVSCKQFEPVKPTGYSGNYFPFAIMFRLTLNGSLYSLSPFYSLPPSLSPFSHPSLCSILKSMKNIAAIISQCNVPNLQKTIKWHNAI